MFLIANVQTCTDQKKDLVPVVKSQVHFVKESKSLLCRENTPQHNSMHFDCSAAEFHIQG